MNNIVEIVKDIYWIFFLIKSGTQKTSIGDMVGVGGTLKDQIIMFTLPFVLHLDVLHMTVVLYITLCTS